jgi:hypothetical protein
MNWITTKHRTPLSDQAAFDGFYQKQGFVHCKTSKCWKRELQGKKMKEINTYKPKQNMYSSETV